MTPFDLGDTVLMPNGEQHRIIAIDYARDLVELEDGDLRRTTVSAAIPVPTVRTSERHAATPLTGPNRWLRIEIPLDPDDIPDLADPQWLIEVLAERHAEATASIWKDPR